MDREKINKIMNNLLRKIVDDHFEIVDLVAFHQAMSLEIVQLIKWKLIMLADREAMDYAGTQPAPTEREILADLERSFKTAISNSLQEEKPC